MQKIVPHLWFDTQLDAAAGFYVESFAPLGESRILSRVTLPDTPSGDALSMSFRLAGFDFMGINGGPQFTPNPSVSFFVNFDPSLDDLALEHFDDLWLRLSEDGVPLMELGEYPFAKRYGWIQDRFGVSWQLILGDPEGEPRPLIVPSLLFTGAGAGKSEEATALYRSLFADSELGVVARYPADMEGTREGTIMYSDFTLASEWFASADSFLDHQFVFNEAISLLVRCDDQVEIDKLWQALSAVPEAEACGWLKDAYGVSWQVAPALLDHLMSTGTPEQIARVTEAFLPMKKVDVAALQAAFDG